MKSFLSLKNIHRSPPTVSTSAVNSVTPPRRCSHPTATTTTSSLRFSSFVLHPQSSITKSSSYPYTSFGRCRATSSGPPSPPQTDPPNNEEDSSSSPDTDGQASDFSDNLGRCTIDASNFGIMASLSKAQDTMQIFFAVLFWMSLFFWYSVWDGKNDGRPNKGSRFRR